MPKVLGLPLNQPTGKGETMSRNDWEAGSLVIPSKEWAGFKRGLVAAYKDIVQAQFDSATKAHQFLMAKAKGRRKITRIEWGDWMDSLRLDDDQVREKVERVLDFGLLLSGKKSRPRRPMKKDFEFPNGKTTRFPAGWEGMISLSDNKSRTVHWSTGENNHAVEDARESAMGRAFFRLLNRITWTRGSGGKFVGNDEYNQDDDYEGGGANYVTLSYGPEKKGRRSRW
jgi:hypothetical protein